MRIGLARNPFFDGLDPQIRQSMDRAVSVFAKLGAEIMNHFAGHPPQNRASGRGLRLPCGTHVCHTGALLAGDAFKLRLGANIDMETYMKAKLSLDHLRRTAPAVFRNTDAVLTPTTPVPAPKASELPSTFDEMMANDAVLFRNSGRSTYWRFRRFRSLVGSPT